MGLNPKIVQQVKQFTPKQVQKIEELRNKYDIDKNRVFRIRLCYFKNYATNIEDKLTIYPYVIIDKNKNPVVIDENGNDIFNDNPSSFDLLPFSLTERLGRYYLSDDTSNYHKESEIPELFSKFLIDSNKDFKKILIL